MERLKVDERILEQLSPARRELFARLLREATGRPGRKAPPEEEGGGRLEGYRRVALSQCRNNARRVVKFLEADSVVLDVGANLGLFTGELMRLTTGVTFHLFEPVEELFRRLCRTFESEPRAHCHRLALGEEDGVTRTIFKSNSWNLGWNTLLEEDPGQPSGRIPADMAREEVRIVTLDGFVREQGIERIDLLKIDVEGYEGEVLRGAMPVLRRLPRKPALLVEVAWGTAHPRWTANRRTYEELFDLGYRRVRFDGGTQDILFEPT